MTGIVCPSCGALNDVSNLICHACDGSLSALELALKEQRDFHGYMIIERLPQPDNKTSIAYVALKGQPSERFIISEIPLEGTQKGELKKEIDQIRRDQPQIRVLVRKDHCFTIQASSNKTKTEMEAEQGPPEPKTCPNPRCVGVIPPTGEFCPECGADGTHGRSKQQWSEAHSPAQTSTDSKVVEHTSETEQPAISEEQLTTEKLSPALRAAQEKLKRVRVRREQAEREGIRQQNAAQEKLNLERVARQRAEEEQLCLDKERRQAAEEQRRIAEEVRQRAKEGARRLAEEQQLRLEAEVHQRGEERRHAVRSRAQLVVAGIAVVVLVAVVIGIALLLRTPPLPKPEEPKPVTTPVLPAGMVYVPGGEFLMGSDVGDEYEKPAHKVTVTPFYIDVNEVTCEEYERFIKEIEHRAPPGWVNRTYPPDAKRKPVTGVDWYDASAYAQWAKKRLPTEEEWEFAARGTDGRRYPWGNEWKKEAANAATTAHGHLAEVGEHSEGASPFGALDMVGNAWEWTASKLVAYPGGQLHDKPSGDLRVIRGGSWKSDTTSATTTYRLGWPARDAKDYSSTSFRCVMDVLSSSNAPKQ